MYILRLDFISLCAGEEHITRWYLATTESLDVYMYQCLSSATSIGQNHLRGVQECTAKKHQRVLCTAELHFYCSTTKGYANVP